MHEVLIIGCGMIAGGLDADRPFDAFPFTHAGAFARHRAFTVSACVDPDEGRRRSFQQRWSVEEGAASIAGLRALPGRFSVVSICSPTDCHGDHIEAALALEPRLIFCEKPVTPSSSETRRLTERCASAGVALAVNYTRRWAPDIVQLAAELAGGAWGKVRSATGIYTKGTVHNGGHLVDLLHLLVGSLELVAAGSPSFDHWQDDPSVAALLVGRDGIPVVLTIGHARDYALFELTLVTEAGTLTMLDGGQGWAVRRAGASESFAGFRTLGPMETRPGEYDRAMLAAVDNIAATLESGVALASDATNALAAQVLCEAIRDAAFRSR